MNKILLPLIFICFMASTLKAQDTIRVYYDADWKEIENKEDAVFYRKAYPDSNNTWTVTDYYICNKIQMKGTYKSKKLEIKHGHFIYYNENGTKSGEGNYVDDKYVGVWTNWYENGQIKSLGSYKSDMVDGLWTYWYETGEKKSEGNCLNNRKVNVWQYWYENGKLSSKETYTKGDAFMFESYHENGVMRSQGQIENDMPNGIWTYWNSDGRVFLKGRFERGLKTGEWTRFFPKGEMKLQFSYGVLEGKQPGGVEISD